MSPSLSQINRRLDAIGTCLLTITALRGHLRNEEHSCFYLPCGSFRKMYVYTDELKYIDSFLDYLFSQEAYYRELQIKKNK